MLAFSGPGAVVGALMVSDGNRTGLLVLVWFVLLSVVSVMLAARPGSLTIDATGMTVVNLWRTDRYEFVDCSEFSAWKNPLTRGRQTLVVYDWALATPGSAAVSKGLSGFTSALPQTFGLAPDALVQLLNERHRAAVTTT